MLTTALQAHSRAPATWHIPLNRLVLAEYSHSATAAAQPSLETLALALLTEGLRSALKVDVELDAQKQPTGRYLVDADGPILQALQLLVDTGKIFPDLPVVCH